MNLIKAAVYATVVMVIMFVVLSVVVSAAGPFGMDVSGAYPGVDSFLSTVSNIVN